ncbi:MAG: UDP-glucose 4-epimerase GalE [Actinobacteria bacterium]|nr:UDP-glucose 4-epimerase GalE [Ilumatobacteraceae bacterium]MCX6531324.1 UDP-glucose 4-epimerase GalE [Actinomycetota bacterium]
MTTLVTGGAGYIGAHTVRALRQTSRDVVVLDTLERGNKEAVIDADLVVGDIADKNLVAEICHKYKITEVVHFAAYKAVGESMTQPKMYWQNNVDGTVALLDTLIEHGVDRFVFSSSAAVYGTPKSVPVTENEPTMPESVYAETKLAVENILSSPERSAIKSVSLRYFNAAGASSDNKIGEDWLASQNLVPRVMRALLDQAFHFEVFGDDYPTRDGTCIRDYIHVEDLALAHIKALDYLEHGGKTMICNVGTGEGTSVKQLLEMATKVAQRAVPYTIGARRDGDPVSVYADTRLANSVLDWRATHDLQSIIESAFNWHRTHLTGYR